MAAETGFIIDGTECELPTLDTFTMDEAQILWDYAHVSLEDFAPLEGASDDEVDQDLRDKLRNPGFLKALLHVAYQRANPRLSAQKVKAAVGTVALADAFEWMIVAGGEMEAESGPPASTTEPEPRSARSSVSSSESSGPDSTTSSDEPDADPVNTGTEGSDTSFISDPTTLAV